MTVTYADVVHGSVQLRGSASFGDVTINVPQGTDTLILLTAPDSWDMTTEGFALIECRDGLAIWRRAANKAKGDL